MKQERTRGKNTAFSVSSPYGSETLKAVAKMRQAVAASENGSREGRRRVILVAIAKDVHAAAAFALVSYFGQSRRR